jgi:hypothetical protein
LRELALEIGGTTTTGAMSHLYRLSELGLLTHDERSRRPYAGRPLEAGEAPPRGGCVPIVVWDPPKNFFYQLPEAFSTPGPK